MKTKYSVGQKIELEATIIKLVGESQIGEGGKINDNTSYTVSIKIGKDDSQTYTFSERQLDYQYNQGRLVVKTSPS